MADDDGDAPPASTAGATFDGGSLLRMFQSDFFDSYLHMHYLYTKKERGVHDYLVELLYKRPDEEIHFYLPQLCQLSISREESTLSKFLIDKSARSMHLALKGNWLYQATVEDGISKLGKAAGLLKEEMEMAVVNSRPFAARDTVASPLSSADAKSDSKHSPDLFLRRRAVKYLQVANKNSSAMAATQAAIQRALNYLVNVRQYPAVSPPNREIVEPSAPNMEVPVPVETTSTSTHQSPPLGEIDGGVKEGADELASASPPLDPNVGGSSSIPVEGEKGDVMHSPAPVGQAAARKRKSKVAPGFVTTSGPITVPQAKIKLSSVYQKLSTPFAYTSFSRESHGDLLDDSELQPFIIKQRRCEYFNLIDKFVNMVIEASNKLVNDPDKSLRNLLIREFARSIDEWILCRRCIVAASEGIFAMTGLVVPFTRFGVEPELQSTNDNIDPTDAPQSFLIRPTPSPQNTGMQFASVQILRISSVDCRVFSSRKRAPYLLIFELGDLDEDLRGVETKIQERTLKWSDLYVYDFVCRDLKNRELYIPPFLSRPITRDELAVIENPVLRTRSCDFCWNPPDQSDGATSSSSVTTNETTSPSCPFQCLKCEGTKIFYDAIKAEQYLIPLRRSLGVPLRDSQTRLYACVPPYRAPEPPATPSPPPTTPDKPGGGGSSSGGPANGPRRASAYGKLASKGTDSSSARSASAERGSLPASDPVRRPSPSRPTPSRSSPATEAGGSDTAALNRLRETSSTSFGQAAATVSASNGNKAAPPLFIKGESARDQAQRLRHIIWGELWEEMKARIRSASPFGGLRSWRLGAVMVKGGDDVRQELLASQLIQQCRAIFEDSQLPLWLKPYEILVAGAHCGIIEFVPDTQSVDAIKQKLNCDSIAKIFNAAFADNLFHARRNFIESHAAYSLVSYLLQVKDRHNGNLLLNAQGRLIHIDYGFMLSNSPGYVNFETSPFKLSAEILQIMDGVESENFEYFKELIVKGFLALRKHRERIFLVVDMMCSASKMPCFSGNPEATMIGLRERFMENISERQVMGKVLDLIDASINNWRTQQYDNFQRLTNGIM